MLLTLVLLFRTTPTFANSVDPDQMASEEAIWSGSALIAIKYVNLYQQSGSGNLIGWSRSGCGILIYSAGQGLMNTHNIVKALDKAIFQPKILIFFLFFHENTIIVSSKRVIQVNIFSNFFTNILWILRSAFNEYPWPILSCKNYKNVST